MAPPSCPPRHPTRSWSSLSPPSKSVGLCGRSSHAIAKHEPVDYTTFPTPLDARRRPPTPRSRAGVRIIHIKGPKVVTTDPSSFRSLVQHLTGFKPHTYKHSAGKSTPGIEVHRLVPSPTSNEPSSNATTSKPHTTSTSTSTSSSSYTSSNQQLDLHNSIFTNNVVIHSQPHCEPSPPHRLPLQLLTPLAFQEQLQQQINTTSTHTHTMDITCNSYIPESGSKHDLFILAHEEHDHGFLIYSGDDDDDHNSVLSTSTPNITESMNNMNTSLPSISDSSPTNSLVIHGDYTSLSSNSSTSSSINCSNGGALDVENYNYSPTLTSPSTTQLGDDDNANDDDSTREWDIIYGLLCDIPTNIIDNNNYNYNTNTPPLQYSFSHATNLTNFGHRDLATSSSTTTLVPMLEDHSTNISKCHYYSSQNIPARFL